MQMTSIVLDLGTTFMLNQNNNNPFDLIKHAYIKFSMAKMDK